MQKNSILFVVLSSIAIYAWYFFFAPQAHNHNNNIQIQVQNTSTHPITRVSEIQKINLNKTSSNNQFIEIEEEIINIESEKYKAVFTNKGAAILSWSIKEKNGHWINLVLPESSPVMSNLPNSIYKIVSKSNNKIIFEHISTEGWKITKTYNLSDLYMHSLDIVIEKNGKTKILTPQIDLKWGPGLGTDIKEMKENIALTRALAYTIRKPNKLKKLKNSHEIAPLFKWAAIDNRYFLAAFIPKNSSDFNKIISTRFDKKHPYSLVFTATVPQDVAKKEWSINFYLGPKSYTYLKTHNLGLEKTVDFGFFGFLGKIVFTVLTFFYKITQNYGWAIIMITTVIQILVLPLTLKSLKSVTAMKHIQPMIKDIQTKYKDNPKRLQVEMLNIYKSQKVNPFGGCLPMLLQLPIFWAFFTMLRNAYELRNEAWFLWIKDLSASDKFVHFGSFNINLLPIIMGLGMFLQQKMTAATSDPAQRKIMYIMPIMFTFMFWSFPSGLVIYWITNSIISIIEQYFMIRRNSVHIKRF